MSASRTLSGVPGTRIEWPSLAAVPYLGAIAAAYLVFGPEPALAGLMLAVVLDAVAYRPLTPLAQNNWQPLPPYQCDPTPTPRAKSILLGLWVATAWIGAALTALAA
jgi:hypothetical protein